MDNLLVTHRQARELIESAKKSGRIFSVVFYKRTDNSRREMVCRGKVYAGVLGVGLKYDPADHELISVFDMQKRAFRMISADTIETLKINGLTFTVVD